MKKIVCLLLVVLMAVCSVVYAEGGFDLSSMSLDELVALHKAVDAEIDARIGCEPSTIADGVYIAGTSIKAGAYTITCSETYDETGMVIQVFENQDKYEEFLNSGNNWYAPGYQLYSGSIAADQTATISLADGMVLVISGGAGMVQEGNPIWAP